MSTEGWDVQLGCLEAIANHAQRIREHLARIEQFLKILDRHNLPHPTVAEEEIRLTMALCASALETLKTPPVVIRWPVAAE